MRVRRFDRNPLIHPAMDAGIGDNINGPSLIRTPRWLARPLGRYYLYFAAHGGEYIRLAVADGFAGPWRIHAPGTLRLEQTACRRHIASPDVHVDDARREIRMYFHGPADGGQKTFLATSRDGLDFTADRTALGPFYFRVFAYNGAYYAIAKNVNVDGVLLRSPDGRAPFAEGPHFLPGMRHVALRRVGEVMQIFLSRAGDAPEHIMVSEMPLRGEWTQWRPSPPRTVLLPEADYEGADLPLEPSRYGAVRGRARQLRDPAIYEEDGRTYLFYSIAGESGIAGAELEG